MTGNDLQGLQTARAASVRDPLVQRAVHATPRTLAAEGKKESEFVRVYYIASSSFHRRRRRLIAHISQCIFTQLRKPSEIEIEGKVS